MVSNPRFNEGDFFIKKGSVVSYPVMCRVDEVIKTHDGFYYLLTEASAQRPSNVNVNHEHIKVHIYSEAELESGMFSLVVS